MERKQMKDGFESLNPTEEQMDKMWEKLSKASQEKAPKNKFHSGKIMRYAAAAAVVVLVVSLSKVGLNAGAQGKIVEMLKEAIGIEQNNQDIVGQAEMLPDRGTAIYAPDILYIDEKWLVFGNLRGLLVYDRQQQKLMGTIDTQAIGCMYFGGDSKQTHVLKQQKSLILFNSDNGVPYGSYYQFDLTEGKELALTSSTVGNDTGTLNGYYSAWKEEDKKYVDTFETFNNMYDWNDEKNPQYKSMYSERSVKWTDKSGDEQISYFVIQNNKYILTNYQPKTAAVTTQEIDLSGVSDGQQGNVVLPQFEYTGNDKAVKAICEYMRSYNESRVEEGQIWIPGFVIYKQVKKGNELLVFGNFWSSTYLLNGVILESVGGGESPACIRLKEEGDTVRVISAEFAGDGAYYAKDIRRFTKGYAGLYDRFMDRNDGKREAACKEYLQMYVKDNGLNIQYYKEYGWDPVKIFD